MSNEIKAMTREQLLTNAQSAIAELGVRLQYEEQAKGRWFEESHRGDEAVAKMGHQIDELKAKAEIDSALIESLQEAGRRQCKAYIALEAENERLHKSAAADSERFNSLLQSLNDSRAKFFKVCEDRTRVTNELAETRDTIETALARLRRAPVEQARTLARGDEPMSDEAARLLCDLCDAIQACIGKLELVKR